MRKILNDYPKHKKVQLKIGEGRIFIKPTIVTTVLGSCVSVAFFCPAKTMGGIFHALMPEMPEGEKKMLVQNHFKYVDSSIQQIVRLFERKGIKPHQLKAKVFGGAQAMMKGEIKPGQNNIRVAFELLAAHKIKILASDVGGRKGRNLIFITDTGEVFVKTHKKSILGNLKEKK